MMVVWSAVMKVGEWVVYLVTQKVDVMGNLLATLWVQLMVDLKVLMKVYQSANLLVME